MTEAPSFPILERFKNPEAYCASEQFRRERLPGPLFGQFAILERRLAEIGCKPTIFPLRPFAVDAAGKAVCSCRDPDCKNAGKHPAVSWKNFHAGEQRLMPGATGYGLCTGERSGIVVIDIDSDAAEERLRAEHEVPATLTVKTTKGRHLIFKAPERAVKGSASEIAPKVDVRGHGGMVVMAGSAHASGVTYFVESDLPIADMPAWVLEHPATFRNASAAASEADEGDNEADEEGDEAGEAAAIIGGELRVISRVDPSWPIIVNEAEHDAETTEPCLRGQQADPRMLQFARRLRQHYGLPRDEARRILGIFAARSPADDPWTDAQLEHKLDETKTRRLPASGVASGWAEYQAPGSVWWPLRSPKNATIAPPPWPPASANDNRAPTDGPPEPGKGRGASAWRQKPNSNHKYTFATSDSFGGASSAKKISKKDLAAMFVGPHCTAPEWSGVWQYDCFARSYRAVNPPLKLLAETEGLQDADLISIGLWLEYQGHAASKEAIADMAKAAGQECAYHPVREYLDSLPKLSVEEAEEFFKELAAQLWGAEGADIAIESDFLRRFGIAAVRRIRVPGTKVDTILVLYGRQGTNKSRFAEHLFSRAFYSDQVRGIDTKEGCISLQGVWGAELGEMASFVKQPEAVKKDYLSRCIDRYRPLYEGEVITRPREVVFMGTTNQDDFLEDATGDRRYWVCKMKRPIDLAAFDRDAFWAAAAAIEAQGAAKAPHFYPTTEEGNPVNQANEQFRREDPWQGTIVEYCAKEKGSGKTHVFADGCLNYAILQSTERQDDKSMGRVRAILRRLCGAAEVAGKVHGVAVRGYRIPDHIEAISPSPSTAPASPPSGAAAPFFAGAMTGT